MPALRKRLPIRLSIPMPLATCSTSASTASHRLATTLIKEIFIARKALEACLMSSAALVEVCRMGGDRRGAMAGNGV